MSNSRRTILFVSAALLAAAPAFAQQGYAPSGVPSNAYREWPGNAAQATRPQVQAPDGETIDSEGGGAIPALPLEVQTVAGITYVTGGIGDEEKAQLTDTVHQYNLHLLMNSPGGAFISDVDLHLADASGKELLAVPSAGPYFYARLSPGNYIITLNSEGETKKVPIKIGTGDTKKEVQFSQSGGVITPHAPTSSVEH